MKINSLLCFAVVTISVGLLSAIVTIYDLSSNNLNYFGKSYGSSDSSNSSSDESINDTDSTDSNEVSDFNRVVDDLFSENNITGNDDDIPASLTSFLEENSNITSDEALLDGMASENITTPSSSSFILNATDTSGAGTYPGILQIPFTGLSRYHMTPAVSKLFGLDETTYAMLVTRVEPGSPAAIAGIRGGNITTNVGGEIIKVGGDIILEVDSNSSLVRNNDAFRNYLQNDKKVGENITLTILRDGQTQDIEMTIGAVPRFLWYDNRDEGIRMKYPSDWDVDESSLSKQDIVKFFSPETTSVDNDSLPIAGTFVKIAPTESSLDDIASAQQEGTPTTRVLDMFLTNVSNLPGYEIVFYDYADRDRTLKILSVLTIKDGQIYRINFAVDPPRYNDYLPLAQEMIESFQFTK